MSERLVLQTEIEGRVFRLYESPGVAPAILIDGIHGLSITNDVIRINGYRARMDHNVDGTAEKVVDRDLVVQIMMSVGTLMSVVDLLNKIVKDLHNMSNISNPNDPQNIPQIG